MLQTMKDWRAAARTNEDQGFTLIELMVVVLIIAILLAIAIPTFLGAQNRAKDRNAQSSTGNTVTNAQSLYSDTQQFGADIDALVTTLTSGEPNLAFNKTTSTSPKLVAVSRISPTEFAAVTKSDNNTCFAMYVNLGTTGAIGTYYGKPAVTAGSAGPPVVTAGCAALTAAPTIGVAPGNFNKDEKLVW